MHHIGPGQQHRYTMKSQEAFEAKRLSKIVAILVLRSVSGQSCYRLIEVTNKQAESHKNIICTMQLECLMFVNVMPAAMNRSSKLPCMRSSFVYALVYRSISEWCISGGPGTLV